jgi:nicotinamide-nucleotide amidase
MKAYFLKKGFQLTTDNEKQAMLPVGAVMLTNHNGTAPGFFLSIQACMFFCMPGVPSEMKLMFEREVKPVLVKQFDLSSKIRIERLTVFGLPESRVGSALAGFEAAFPGFMLGFRADFPMIEVKIVHSLHRQENITDMTRLAKARQWAVERLENRVVSEEGLTLAQEVGRLLIEQKKTLAIAESCTGGLIANMVTDSAGSSAYFLFSGITYSNDAKINILKVNPETLIRHGAVHEATACEMARGARLESGADVAVSTTGIAGPGGGTPEKPVGMVCIGLSSEYGETAKTYRFTFDDRMMNKRMFAMTALERLRRHLLSQAETF